MPGRDVDLNVDLNDRTGPGALSVERRLERLEDAAKRVGRKMSDRLRDSGDDGGRGFAASFVGRAGPIVAKMPLGPHVAVAVAGAAPVIAASLGAAIAAGAAAGAVGIGAAIVSQEPEVRVAAAGLGRTVSASMRADARPMVAPVLAGLATLDRRAEMLRPKFRQIFTDAARYAPTFTRAVDQSLNTVVEGFADIVAGAGPVVDMLGVQIPRTVAVVVGGLRQMTAESGNSASALSLLFSTVQIVAGAAATSVSILNKILPFTTGSLLYANEQIVGSGEAADAADPSLQGFIDKLTKQGEAGAAAAAGTAAATAATISFTQASTSAFSAETRLGQALDEVTGKQYNNSAGLSINTEKGRQNRQALERLAVAGREAAAAAQHHGGGAQRAAAIMNQSYDAFVKAARGMGISEQAARDLAASLGLIKSKTVTITTRYVVKGGRADGSVHVSGPGGSGTQVKGFSADGPAGGSWAPAAAASSARAAFDAARASFDALSVGGGRTGGPVEVSSSVAVLLDGRPFRDLTVRAVEGERQRAAWRSRVGRRDR